MSKKTPRVANDAYMTPTWQVNALLSRFPPLEHSRILEPCSGDDAIVNAIRASFQHPKVQEKCPTILTNDIDKARPGMMHWDARSRYFWAHVVKKYGKPEFTISNTPFNGAIDIIKRAFDHSLLGMAFLLRISWFEPTKERGPWLAAHPPDSVIYLPRWSYAQNGSTDNVTTAWACWFHDPKLRTKYRGLHVHPTKS